METNPIAKFSCIYGCDVKDTETMEISIVSQTPRLTKSQICGIIVG